MQKPATISKDESNILVAIGKLETQIVRMSEDISSARSEIKEINTGITARLLNLEGNSVSRIELKHEIQEVSDRIESVEQRFEIVKDDQTKLATQLDSYWRAVVIVGCIIVAILGVLEFVIQLFFK